MLLCVFGVTLAAYLLFFRHNSTDASAGSRREAPEEPRRRLPSDEELKRPVYEKPPLDMNALGEMGRAVRLNLDGEEKVREEESIRKHQINIYVSDQLSLHRRLPERWNPL